MDVYAFTNMEFYNAKNICTICKYLDNIFMNIEKTYSAGDTTLYLNFIFLLCLFSCVWTCITTICLAVIEEIYLTRFC